MQNTLRPLGTEPLISTAFWTEHKDFQMIQSHDYLPTMTSETLPLGYLPSITHAHTCIQTLAHTCTHTCLHMHTHDCTHLHSCTCICTHVHMLAHLHTHTHVLAHARNMFAQAYTHACTRTCLRVVAHIHACTCVCAHAYTHASTHMHASRFQQYQTSPGLGSHPAPPALLRDLASSPTHPLQSTWKGNCDK